MAIPLSAVGAPCEGPWSSSITQGLLSAYLKSGGLYELYEGRPGGPKALTGVEV